jgi:hypothetical protein
MTIVAIKCPSCPTVSNVTVGAVLLDGASGAADEEAAATITWICVGCCMLVDRPIGWQSFLRLVSAGAALVDETEDEGDVRPRHPESAVEGPLWTPDDLLDLHTLLTNSDWFAEVEATTDTPADHG